jgi:hypothetical protein
MRNVMEHPKVKKKIAVGFALSVCLSVRPRFAMCQVDSD